MFYFLYVFYFGGVWECMIGVICRILDSMFLWNGMKGLIYDIFFIFLVEVCIIVNLRLFIIIMEDVSDLFIFIFVMIFI